MPNATPRPRTPEPGPNLLMTEIADLVTDAWCDTLVERQLLRLAAEHEPGDREFDSACRVAGQRLEARFRALDTKVRRVPRGTRPADMIAQLEAPTMAHRPPDA